jgi:CubicO group peptidase (beta-lactamase class C family)
MTRPHRPRPSAWLLVLTLVLAALPAPGAPTEDPLASWLSARRQDGGVESAVVVRLTAADTTVAALGATATGATPDATTRYPIGSVTKVFTNLLLREMAAAGLVSPTDTLGAFLPDHLELRNPAVARIPLAALGTHTSGLPRMPGNFFPDDRAQPFADYDTGRLWQGLAVVRNRQPLGEHFAYSNLGLGLLGHLLGRVDGRGYCAALAARVLEPRGLAATSCEAGQATEGWRFQALAGAGALWSSAADLAALVRQVRALPADHPTLAVRTTPDGTLLTPVWLAGRAEAGPVLWHNGSIGHAHAFLGLRHGEPAADGDLVGLVVLVAGRADPTAVCLETLGAELGEAPPLPPRAQELTGQYQVTASNGLGIFRSGEKLVVRMTGQTAQAIEPVGGGWWALTTVDASLRFRRGEDGAVTGVTIVQNGFEMQADRTAQVADAVRRQALDLPPAELDAYVGRYRLTDQLLLTVTRREDTLSAGLTGQPSLAIFPFAPDRFAYRAVDAELHFRRGADGEVTGVTLHQGGMRLQGERQ